MPGAVRNLLRNRFLCLFAICFLIPLTAVTGKDTCGGVDAPCSITSGQYYFALPKSPPGPRGYPVMVHLHGWSSSARAVMDNGRFVEKVLSRGYVLIAPFGEVQPSGRRDWSVADGQTRPRRDDGAFLSDVLDDAVKRLKINRSRVLLTGFSRGGSMVWDLACRTPGTFTAYAAVGGGFWNPLPQSCKGPVRIFHTHGWVDATVPLEGRRLGNSGLVQGDIFEGLSILKRTNGCPRRASERHNKDNRWIRSWNSCAEGSELRLMLHPRGHITPKGWTEMALDWFEAIVSPQRRVETR